MFHNLQKAVLRLNPDADECFLPSGLFSSSGAHLLNPYGGGFPGLFHHGWTVPRFPTVSGPDASLQLSLLPHPSANPLQFQNENS